MSAAPKLPEGLDPKAFKIDAKGKIAPIALIKEIDLLRDDVVTRLCEEAKSRADEMALFRRAAMGDVVAFTQLSAQKYGVNAPAKGNLTLYSYDGRYRIVRATAERLVFDERLQAAKALIDECIRAWSATSDPKIVALVNDAFQVEKEGEVSTARVLGLKRLNFGDDQKWKEAMRAIDDSVHTAESRSYLRFYERDEDGEYQPIALDFSKAGAR